MNLTFDRLWGARDKMTKQKPENAQSALIAICRWIVVAVVGATVAAAIILNGSDTGRLTAAIAGSAALAIAAVPILWCVWLHDRNGEWNVWNLQAGAIAMLGLASFAHAAGLLDDPTDLIRPAWIDTIRLAGAAIGGFSAAQILRRQSPDLTHRRRVFTATLIAAISVGVVFAAISLYASSSLSSVTNVAIGLALIAAAAFIVACFAASELPSANQPHILSSSLALGWLAISIDLINGGIYRVLADSSTKDAISWMLVIAGAFLFVSAIGPAGITRSTQIAKWKQARPIDESQLSLLDWARIIAPYALIALASSAAWAVRDSAAPWVSVLLAGAAVIILGRQALIHAGGTRAIERSERALVDLAQRAMIDAVTELPNRRALDERLAEEVDRALLLKQPLSLCFVDIDHFKSINDVHGHHTGDAILRQVGALLRRSLRNVDFIGRFGGEEFVVLVPETWSEEAVHLGEVLRTSIESAEFTSPDKNRLRLTVSVGIAGLPEHAHDAALLCIRADEALYSAKRAGRNRVSVFDPKEPVPQEA